MLYLKALCAAVTMPIYSVPVVDESKAGPLPHAVKRERCPSAMSFPTNSKHSWSVSGTGSQEMRRSAPEVSAEVGEAAPARYRLYATRPTSGEGRDLNPRRRIIDVTTFEKPPH
jgi:hypothetical protein